MLAAERKRRQQQLKNKPKRKREQPEEDFEDEEGLNFDSEGSAGATAARDEVSEDDNAHESAAEARLRMAKSYIHRIKAAAGSDDEDGANQLLSERLQAEAREAAGRVLRKVSHKVHIAEACPRSESTPYGSGRLLRGHRLSATAVALADDDATAFTVTKCGSILRWDIESGSRQVLHRPGDPLAQEATRGTQADWVHVPPRKGSANSLYAVCVSGDGRFLAAAGGDKRVHVWDLRVNKYLQGFKGHKDLVSGVAFRSDSSQLFSCSFDRSIKLWSVDDRAYMDTLFGHQSEVTAVDVLRHERCVTAGFDRTCRIWKVPEESQLIYRASGLATDAVKYVSGTEWLSGCYDGSVALWSQLKKKPVCIHRGVHNARGASEGEEARGPGCPAEDAAGWVQSVATCPGADLAASGAGDGLIRLWSIQKGTGHNVIEQKGSLAARGFVNGIAIARSGRFLVAAVGQEPRLGRWLRDKAARNCTLVHQIPFETA